MSNVQAFVDKMMPYAEEVNKATGVPVDGVLTQWAEETGYGTSRVCLQDNNYAGISPGTPIKAGTDGGYAKYSSIGQFVQSYIGVLNQSNFRQAKASRNAHDFFVGLKTGGWATDPNYVSTLDGVYNTIAPYVGKAPTSHTGAGIDLSGLKDKLGSMSHGDLNKYALVGLGVVTIVALLEG